MIAARVSALAIAAVLGASLVQAQTTPPPSPPAAGAGHHWDGAAMREHREAREAAHLKALHDVLAIRPEQETAFQTFATSMHPKRPDGAEGRREPGAQMKDHAAMASMTTPERLDAALKRFDERTAHMREGLEQRATAVKSFYAVLSPEQKRTLDALPELRGGGMRGGWGHGGDGHGPRGGGMGSGRMGEGE